MGLTVTQRQLEIIRRRAAGQERKAIADDLEVSIKTVDKHIEQAQRRLHIPSMFGLVRWWWEKENEAKCLNCWALALLKTKKKQR